MSRPTAPCPTDNSPVFWKSADGNWHCYIHDGPKSQEDVILKHVLSHVAKAAAAAKVFDSETRPSAPCPLDGGEVFWLSQEGIWSCASHNLPIDEKTVAQVFDVETQELVEGPAFEPAPKSKTTKGGPVAKTEDIDWARVAKRINRIQGTNFSAKQVKDIAEEILEEEAMATKSGGSVTRLRLKSLVTSQHAAVQGAKDITGAPPQRRPAIARGETRDFAGRRIKDDS